MQRRHSRRNRGRTKGIRQKSLGGTLLSLAIVVALYFVLGPSDADRAARLGEATGYADALPAGQRGDGLDPALRRAISKERSGVMVTFEATVSRLLSDDNEGSRHQRFIMTLPEPIGDVRTIMVAHNIDLAQRVPCEEGQRVTVRGQYEWNEKGGVIHWTHRDPGGLREGGWIEHAGVRYE